MDSKQLLSEDPIKIAVALGPAINKDKQSKAKSKARVGQRYYDYEHDILKNRIFYIDDNGVLQEDKYASNVQIPHTFFTELVDQKVQYLLSNPLEVEVEDETFKEYLKEYYDDDFQLFLQESLEGASIKGHEYIFARTNSQDRLCFQVADSLHVFPVYDENNDVQANVYYYDKDIYKDGKTTTITIAELWDKEKVTFFVSSDKRENLELDANRELNPRPHVIARTNEGDLLQRGYGTIPFYRLSNNKKELTDLEPIKALIDDYDLMAAFLSNNLQDFAEAIYVVRGFHGDDLSVLRQNVKSKKVVATGSDGGLDIKTVEIPVEARKTKLDIDQKSIYKFGMGFDSTQIVDSRGSVTNVAIRSGYALLDMKANKAEVRLRSMLAWINNMIVEDINRRFGATYKASDIKVSFARETTVNQEEIANIEKINAETKATTIEAILAAAPRLDDESILKLICEQYELDWEEVQLLLEEQEYTSGLQDGTDPVEDDEDEAGQVE